MFNLEVGVGYLVEFLRVRAVSTLDAAIEFGRSRRQDKELDAASGAFVFECGLKLAAAVYLDCPYREGHSGGERVQEAGGVGSGGLLVHSHDVPAGDGIVGCEMLQGHSGQGSDVQSIQLDEVSGPADSVLPGLSAGIRTKPLSLTG